MRAALPHFALVGGVHGRADWALEVCGELLHVGERSGDAEAAGRVEAGRDAQLDGLVAVHRAPRVGRAQPEQLQNGFVTMNPLLFISSVLSIFIVLIQKMRRCGETFNILFL